MNAARLKSVLLPVVLAVGLLAAPPRARAGFIVNGDFSQGLTGWGVENDTSAVTVSGGLATIAESSFFDEVDLYQVFTLPNDVQSLSFQITSVSANSDASDSVTPAAFNVSLLNPNDTDPFSGGHPSLVSTTPDPSDPFQTSTDAFYIRDLVNNHVAPIAAYTLDVTVSSTDTFPITVTLNNLSSLAGQEVELNFRLIGSSDLSDVSSVSITNILVNSGSGSGGGGGPSVVPAPPSLLLFGTGSLALVGRTWRSRRARQGTC